MRKQTMLAAAGVLLIGVAPVLAQQTNALRGGTPVVRSTSPVQALLAHRVGEVDWDDMPLDSVVEWLLDQQAGVNVVVAWRALEAVGIDRDVPISLRMRNVTVAQVLNEALDQIGDGIELRYRGSGNTLKISTRDEFNRKLYVRVYDVSDLIFTVPDFKGPSVDLGGGEGGAGTGGGMSGGMSGGMMGGGMSGGMGGMSGGMGGGMMGGGMMGGSGSQNPFSGGDSEDEDDTEEKSLEERMDEIVVLIRETIEPESWVENGGRNSVRAYKRSIIVRAPIEIHELIGGPFVLPE